MSKIHNIAIFASGNGTNAENIVKYFNESDSIHVKCVLSNNDKAGVHERIKPFGIPSVTFSKEIWNEANGITKYLESENIELIVLAGFLAFIRDPITSAFKDKIINIHPSLLPKFGGKGMFGLNVHKAVIDAKEKESGITIHYVSSVVDGGGIILQKKCNVYPDDTPETLCARINQLEYKWLPTVIEKLLK